MSLEKGLAQRRMPRRQLLAGMVGLSGVALLAACQTTAAPATPAATAKPAATSAPAATAAPAATKAAASTPAPAATAAGKALKVGLVTDVGKIDDKSFNQSAWEGVQQYQKEQGGDIKFVETTDPKDYAKNISQFGDANYDVIVTVGFAIGEATYAAAKKYPNVKFIGIDQGQFKDDQHPDIPLKNVSGLIFDEDKAGYLAGVLAALMSKSGTIGSVCGTDIIPPVWRYGEGFKAGAKSVKPDIKYNVVYHSDVGLDKTFIDPEWGKTTALSMIDKGADIIFAAGGQTGNGALQGAAQKNVLCIGVDTDQYFTLPEVRKVLLSSAMKLITPGVVNLLKTAKDNKFPPGNFVGTVGLAPYHDLDAKVPADVKAKIQQVDKGLQDGSIKTNVPPVKPA
ncbi:MAG: BMP family lipoprotein [Chloroflexota bacterium]